MKNTIVRRDDEVEGKSCIQIVGDYSNSFVTHLLSTNIVEHCIVNSTLSKILFD